MLTVDDVIQYTHGRLEDDDETARLLAAGYAAARNYCNWHVTPARTGDIVTLHGPYDQLLPLPTMQLLDLTDVVEEGTALDVTELLWVPADGQPLRGLVRKPHGRRWSRRFNSVVVTMDHGFDVAPDFDQAVLELVDRMSLSVGTMIGAGGTLMEKRVDDVIYRWNPPLVPGMLNTSLIDIYRLVLL